MFYVLSLEQIIKDNTMKTNFFLYLLSFCSLLFIDTVEANSNVLFNGMEITLSGNDVPFEYLKGPEQEHRSIPFGIPISASLNDSHSIDLDFYQAIGEIEIVISQHGTVIHSSFENIESSMIRSIQLSQGLSGDFLLEIKGRNGAYAYGWFTIN